MNNRESIVRRIDELESENLGHLATMAKSDAHAAKCSKLGLSFAETYPADLAEYNDAVDKFHANEQALEALKAELADLPEEGPEPGPGPEKM